MAVPDEATPHILIVDDDRRIRELLKKYLNDNGYRTSAAADATHTRDRDEHRLVACSEDMNAPEGRPSSDRDNLQGAG